MSQYLSQHDVNLLRHHARSHAHVARALGISPRHYSKLRKKEHPVDGSVKRLIDLLTALLRKGESNVEMLKEAKTFLGTVPQRPYRRQRVPVSKDTPETSQHNRVSPDQRRQDI